MHDPIPDPFALALEAERIDAEATVSQYLDDNVGTGPSIDLFLKIYNPQIQSLHERLGLSRLIGLFQGRVYWNRRARMLLGDHVPYSEGAPNVVDAAMFEPIYDNYIAVMSVTVEGFAAVDPVSREAAAAHGDLRVWIESTRHNISATVRELIDIVQSEQRLDPNNAGQTLAPVDPIGDIFASSLADSKPVMPPDRTPMLQLAALACSQELALRNSLHPNVPRARPPTPQPRAPQARGRSRRVIEDDDERLLPRSRPVQGQPKSREWILVDEGHEPDEYNFSSSPPVTADAARDVPRLGYGSEDKDYPFVLP